MYRAVVRSTKGNYAARALVGSHSISLSWNHTGPAADRATLLGFAIHRFDLTAKRDTWIKGQKRFAGQELLGDNLESRIAPIQKFRWGDYGAYPDHRYRYEIHPVKGTPAAPKLRPPVILRLDAAPMLDNGVGVYSNRGVSASLAYNQKFKNAPQDLPEPKRSQAYAWLTRDILPALQAYIGNAVAGDELRVAIYEFEDADIIGALKAAAARGVRVRIIYHARAGDGQTAENTANVATLGLPGADVIPRTKVPNIGHNKFIVHRVPDGAGGHTAARVWTGSTNFTRSGLYLQTNVGLALEAPGVADAFSRYWDLLAGDPDSVTAKALSAALIAAVRPTLPSGPTLHFSPIAGKELLDVAVDLVANAKELVFISSPFGLDGQIITAINANNPNVVEYGLVNTTQGKMIKLIPHADNRFSWFTTPAWLPEWDGKPWDAKPLGQHKIHTKSIVTDPFSTKPRALVGSANFSDESVNKNDENALLIEGDRRSAAIVATEFLRMFDHYKTRAFIASLPQKPDDRYLASDGSWTIPYYESFRLKFREREVFAG
jgi:phosphatidylserine/phosphatidylglycerophosphate/cardiolipin synthase-like enzyme